MTKRFYSPVKLGETFPASMKMEDQEAHHLIHVMRAQVNEEVTLFDGSGAEFEARIQKLEKRAVLLEITARHEIDREPKTRLSIGVALPKGDRQQFLCEKLVELGCYELTPLFTRRGVAEPGEAAVTRLRRFVIEASKQCGRNKLLQIATPCSIADFLSFENDSESRVFLDASGAAFLTASDLNSDSAWRVAIGPEGGWADEELALAREKSWPVVSLGSRILRVETAAAAICARLCTN